MGESGEKKTSPNKKNRFKPLKLLQLKKISFTFNKKLPTYMSFFPIPFLTFFILLGILTTYYVFSFTPCI